MKAEIRKKLNEILRDNKKWPIILEGVDADSFKNATILPAIVKSEELSIALQLPVWIKALEERKKEKTNVLVIDGMDVISADKQKKFKQILDQKAINGYKFPENVQIVLTIGGGNRDKISALIQSLCIYFKV